jgi:CBS domain containing-hemolysin-like protein
MNKVLYKSLKWSTGIAVITLVLAAIFSIVSTLLIEGVAWAIGVMIVFLIVLIGIVFDIIGVAATAVDEVPFHAMASEKIKGSRQAIAICRNADRVASFCNDVIGDISGIISGTASAAVIVQLARTFAGDDASAFQYTVSIVFTSVVAALTVGGKALGKSFAISFSTSIIFQVGRVIYFFEERLKLKKVMPQPASNKLKRNTKGK